MRKFTTVLSLLSTAALIVNCGSDKYIRPITSFYEVQTSVGLIGLSGLDRLQLKEPGIIAARINMQLFEQVEAVLEPTDYNNVYILTLDSKNPTLNGIWNLIIMGPAINNAYLRKEN